MVASALAALVLGRGRLFLRDWIPFVALFFAYELMRGYADKFGLPIHVRRRRRDRAAHRPRPAADTFLQASTRSGVQPGHPGHDLGVFYFLHFPLPLAIGFLLWIHQRRSTTTSWRSDRAVDGGLRDVPAAARGAALVGRPARLREAACSTCATPASTAWRVSSASATTSSRIRVYSISSNDVAAFPSLHAAYPFLAFLFARRAFGRAGWLMLAYTACVWFAIVYLGEHWVVDIIGGVVYASAAYFVVTARPELGTAASWSGWPTRRSRPASRPRTKATSGALRRLGRRVRWALVVQGLAVALRRRGRRLRDEHAGLARRHGTRPLPLPWLAILGGLWRAAAGLVSR